MTGLCHGAQSIFKCGFDTAAALKHDAEVLEIMRAVDRIARHLPIILLPSIGATEHDNLTLAGVDDQPIVFAVRFKAIQQLLQVQGFVSEQGGVISIAQVGDAPCIRFRGFRVRGEPHLDSTPALHAGLQARVQVMDEHVKHGGAQRAALPQSTVDCKWQGVPLSHT